ncbi:MAG: TonB family protein [Opitutae bacterium]|nr:TonB family protein [Opitutae bacterium]
MNTPDLLRKPRHPRAHFPSTGFAASPPPASASGDWRYTSAPKSRGTVALAVAAAAGLHAAMFYGFPEKTPRPAHVPLVKAEAVIQIAMPPLPPEETEDALHELVDEPTAAVVPQLAEVPTSVALSDFTQPVDLRPKAEVDTRALKSMTIPVARGRGGLGGGGAPTIFSLSQLDRVPQPIAQPMPNFPQNVHVVGIERVTVLVEFVVDAEGRVVEPRVTQSNASEFNNAALAGVLRWKFRPGMLSGRKVATRMEVPLTFDLKTGE